MMNIEVLRPRIGIRFIHKDKEGVILQSGKNLPLYKRTDKEGTGPFFGVSYPNSEYIWYNQKDISEILKQSNIIKTL